VTKNEVLYYAFSRYINNYSHYFRKRSSPPRHEGTKEEIKGDRREKQEGRMGINKLLIVLIIINAACIIINMVCIYVNFQTLKKVRRNK